MKIIDIDKVHIRPRFSLHVRFTPEELKERIQNRLEAEDARIKGYIVMDNVTLNIPDEDQHYWTPQMSFLIEEVETDKSLSHIRGIIGPKPNVWTMFMFFYFFLGTVGLFASMFGLSKWSLGEFHMTVWSLPIALVFMSTAYLTSHFGQKLGHDQVDELKDFVRQALKKDK